MIYVQVQAGKPTSFITQVVDYYRTVWTEQSYNLSSMEGLPGHTNPPANITHPTGTAESDYFQNAHYSQYIGNKI